MPNRIAKEKKRVKQDPPKSVRMPNDTQKLLQLVSRLEGITLGELLKKIGEAYAKQTHPEILRAIENQK